MKTSPTPCTSVKAYVERIEIVADGGVVARHERRYEPGQPILDPLHYLATPGRRLAALDHSRVYCDWRLPPECTDLRQALEQRHGPSAGARQYIRVLELLAQHPLSRVQQAIRQCPSPEALQPIGSSNTPSVWRKRVRFFTAANLVTRLEEAQKQYQLDRFLAQLDKADLLICDQLGYLSFSRAGTELLSQVFADRHERASLLITSDLAFSDWGQVFQGERMTAALLDRLTHRCQISDMNGESYRFRESVKAKKDKDKTNPKTK